eukprot:TRINITY_DN5912_c0_g1_i1.p1 TRINITY_DN5912_c0_g1~~TRINITY_DN5912_c0_g1_i1.p1  ORF type:complete len:494 (-),score=107.89 TRINITY_DN5912_c0_g1_i1:35-1516(-)
MAKGKVRKALKSSTAVKGKAVFSGSAAMSAKSGDKKRKATDQSDKQSAKRKPTDEDIDSDDDSETMKRFLEEESEEEVDDVVEKETADERRARLAREYIEKLEEVYADEAQTEEEARGIYQLVSEKLTQDVKEASGRILRKLAGQLANIDISIKPKVVKLHSLPITALVVSEDGKYAYTASKDCTIVKYEFDSGKKSVYQQKSKTGKGHKGHILALALSSDGKFLASGGHDKFVHIWNAHTGELLQSFSSHRATVNCLAFRRNSHELFSGSNDRTVKQWDLDQMSLTDTLFGHQAEVTAVDCPARDRPVSVSTDRSCRVWKIQEESHLVFHGHEASIDCVAFVNDDNYITGSQDGSLAFWSLSKKKPQNVYQNVHHGYPIVGEIQTHQTSPSDSKPKQHWISSVAVCPHTDVAASGSNDGYIRIWQTDPRTKTLSPVSLLPAGGFVNGLAFLNDGKQLLAVVSQEPRLGRWFREKGAKNGLLIFDLSAASNTE